MIEKIKKGLILITIITAVSSINLLKVEAWGWGGGGGSGNPTDGGDIWGSQVDGDFSTDSAGNPTYGSQCDRASCKIKRSFYIGGSVNADIKKTNGEKITDDIFSGQISTEFLAGTYVMLRVYEHQYYESTATYSVYAQRQLWTCEYKKHHRDPVGCKNNKYTNRNCPENDTIYDDWDEVVEVKTGQECSCPPGSGDTKVSYSFEGWKDVSGEYEASCASHAKPYSVTLSPMYEAIYHDSNDIDSQDITNTTATTVKGQSCDGGSISDIPRTESSGSGISGGKVKSGSCNVSYDRKTPICINVKTSKVRYLDNGETCDNKSEYTILPDEEGYWKYFIPLNANSAEDFTFELKSSGAKQSKVICENIIDNYPDSYQYKITDSKGNTFINKNLTIRQAKNNVSKGCYFQVTATIPVVQKFYNEIENGSNFDGFNFYYKPIDIDNPFPNGINSTSIWKNWEENNKKDPDISKSYDEITYIANISNANANAIRNYNKSNEYTNWYTMYVNGISSYIEKEGIITRYTNRDSFYPLGCGPENENINNEDGSKNYFYQQECDRK